MPLSRRSRRVAAAPGCGGGGRGEACPVCLEARWDEGGTCILPCKHRLCLVCYGKLRESSDRCPLCRRGLPGPRCLPAREAAALIESAAVATEVSTRILENIEPHLDRHLQMTQGDRGDLMELMLSPAVSAQVKSRMLSNMMRVHMRDFVLETMRHMWSRRRRRNAVVVQHL